MILTGFFPASVIAQESTITIDSVSVWDENSIIIGWTLETEYEEGYIEIHGRTSGAHNVIATVPLDQSFYIDEGVDTQLSGYSYYVVAWQTNGDIIVAGDEAHQNVYLKTLTPDICGKHVYLQWDRYGVETTAGNPEPLPSPFENYRVNLSYNEGEFLPVFETDGQQNLAVISAEEPGSYCFKIQALIPGTEITASSNVLCSEISFLPQPQFFLVRKATVEEGTDNVELLFHADNTVPDPAYVIQRQDQDTGNFLPLDTLETSMQTIAWTDLSASASSQKEIYKIEVLDSCRTRVWQSGEVATVYLQAEPITPTINELQWNAYPGWEQGVDEYLVQRRIGESSDFETLAVLDPGSGMYNDDISFIEQESFSEDIAYRLKATEAAGNPFGFTDTVSSNTARIIREVEVFIPNAFNPSSQIPENRVFKPMFATFSPSTYSLTLYNRWGQPVFTSDDPAHPWDGRHNGTDAPAGVYSYVLRFDDLKGNESERRGTVLLVR